VECGADFNRKSKTTRTPTTTASTTMRGVPHQSIDQSIIIINKQASNHRPYFAALAVAALLDLQQHT
jgi:hypothetical protein